MAPRLKPTMGDALVINWECHEIGPITFAAIAMCECGEKAYTAVSGTEQGCKRLVYRKHRLHLEKCRRQRELLALDN